MRLARAWDNTGARVEDGGAPRSPMQVSTWRRWGEAWVSLRIGWVVSLASTIAFAVLSILERSGR